MEINDEEIFKFMQKIEHSTGEILAEIKNTKESVNYLMVQFNEHKFDDGAHGKKAQNKSTDFYISITALILSAVTAAAMAIPILNK